MAANRINTILLRYGEVFLKGNNRSFFESMLVRAIKKSLDGIEYKFIKERGRYFVEEFASDDAPEIISRLKKVFGLHSLSSALKVKSSIEEISQAAADISPKSGTFRVSVKRADKRFPLRSMDIAAQVGGYMLFQAPNLKVDLFNFDFELNIDLRDNGYSYLFYEKIICAGGLPAGTGGKAVLLLSGGIDSPVAAYQMAKRGLKIAAVHYHSYPYTSELALQKVLDIAAKLKPYIPDIEVYIVPFTQIQYAIHEHCPAEYMITIMRRFMMRIAERFARQNEALALITGESLGQVASQTIESISVTDSVVNMPVFRPLIGSDKEEIITTAKRIDTFDISIRPYEDCCTVFLPKNPVIRPKIKDAEHYESKLNISELIDEAFANIKQAEI
ncbi:MAG: tRNA uracil 4-sulfurtransferase ThiI [Clostridia bacterium]